MIKREILEKIKFWLKKDKILILKGARQVGKTYLLKIIKKELERKGEKVAYFLADDIDNADIFKSLQNLEFYLEKHFDFPNNYLYVMIDEFQVINEAGIFLKNIFDKYKDKIQLVVSGSSALEINKNSEYLTGRAIHFNINRISFKEYFDYREEIISDYYNLNNFSKLKIFYDTFKSKLELNLREYLNFGAYPEVLITKKKSEKEEVLKSIIKTYIEKDIINQLKIENISGFNNLIKVLVAQIGQLVNNNELANTVNISINTLKKYLEILVCTYIIDLPKPYFKNIRTEISKMPKVYILDMGIRNYLLRSFDLELDGQGSVIENFVYNAFVFQYDKEYIHFYRTTGGAEIDFVIEDYDNKLALCEVKYRNKIGGVPVVMKNFVERSHDISYQMIVTKNILKQENNIFFVPAVLLPFVEFRTS